MKTVKLNATDKAKWNELVSIAVKLAVNDKWKAYKKHQRRFVRFVDYLLGKYGNTASLLATRADMMNRDSAKVPFFLKAYKLAVKSRNRKEMVFIADSLANIFIFQADIRRGSKWLAILTTNLRKHRDKQCKESCGELEEEKKALRCKHRRFKAHV